ncbi:30S ribosomal protein S4 [Ignisphaera sp. 4213-co]|uniref:Small ribosomal subunit protein uS4 n=1 Tax=Ignisphaera cupida TaxID=3050454 RepID=A0ABD4Z7I4_9CREN|nr:30S ribosomal protein S4 [Ignisphaera sp. 4213-co]MDK6028548.1 30S ribosomal protein S4 [Ignisphaera sp. 4213-co]
MGDPRKSRRKWESPGHPWIKSRLEAEIELLGTYGLRNKRELWIAETMLRRIKHLARSLLALPEDEREKRFHQLVTRLYNIGVLSTPNATITDILNLSVESILERRLQTIVWRKGLAKTIHQARQFIVHGHIAIRGRRVTSPGYLVSREDEKYINFYPNSPYAKTKVVEAS